MPIARFFAVYSSITLRTGAGLQCPIISKRFPSCSGQISRECKRSSRVTAKPQLKSAAQSYDRSFTLLADVPTIVANRPRDVCSLTYIHIQRAVQNTSSTTPRPRLTLTFEFFHPSIRPVAPEHQSGTVPASHQLAHSSTQRALHVCPC